MKTNRIICLLLVVIVLVISNSCTNTRQQNIEGSSSIPFEVFTKFKRVEQGNPLIAYPPPDWAAAAHAIVVGDTVHYIWSKQDKRKFWDIRHSFAPVSNPSLITHDARNPILSPPPTGMDSKSMEYPNPFYNPFDKRFYMYYLVKENNPIKPIQNKRDFW